jgi:aminopeptidase N
MPPKTDTPHPTHLRDYRPAPYSIISADLDFILHSEVTQVSSRLSLQQNPAANAVNAPLVLDGERIVLQSISINGVKLGPERWRTDESTLTITDLPDEPFTLEITNTCSPKANTALSGLYISNDVFCTQCEAEGFRRITYFYDRPDVMARFRVRMEADKTACPVLLSNGNLLQTGEDEGTGRHFAVWHDPFPKPSYLFALVAGDLASIHDSFVTRSGRAVKLGIYVERGKEDRCMWAMEALKTSMRWDEERFGREYDLDVFNIVAVSDFNMGAMENKGLNIFNDKYILALPETATDVDYVNIEAIIAHEYFHNWTGNRITCRDWFQLCLKEGLTVFRDQEFTSDIRSRAVKRVTDVRTLRARQFPEDGGPLAHPVRPSSYIEINNFYTPTVYEKGAEVCRMMQTLIGERAFRTAMDLYFTRHDGEAATIEDFMRCVADASGRDLRQFSTWYDQAGTPQVVAEGHFDRIAKTFTLTVQQHTPPTPGQDEKLPLHIPLGLGLVGPDGEDMPLDLEGTGVLNAPLIELKQQSQTYRFRNVAKRPVLSLNRGFSAPIQLTVNMSAEDQLFLMGRDRDSFNRWEAGQMRGRALILAAVKGSLARPDMERYAAALKDILEDGQSENAFKALMLGLPTESEVAAALGRDVDTDLVLAARDTVRAELGRLLSPALERTWIETREAGDYRPDPASTGRRALRYAVLQLMVFANRKAGIGAAMEAYKSANNMSAEMGALAALVQVDCAERQDALDQFHARHRQDHLLIDKWLMLNAQCTGRGAAARIDRLTHHPDFKWTTPNKVYALFAAFTSGNTAGFNAADGSGYRVLADAIIRLNGNNPQVAARIATGFRSYRVLDAGRKASALIELNRILAESNLSGDVYEIVSRIASA